ncbi:hypothetical protein CJ195_17840 [Bacillus sp. UMB0899]|nr:hypothetical protein CJ195_17840 [Bacillus sp. UMB0899]
MKHSVKRITVIASGLIVTGILLAVIGFFAGAKFSIILTDRGLKAVGKEDRQFEDWTLKQFKNIEVDLADAKIEVIPSNEYRLEIESLEGNITHEIQQDTLIINDETSNHKITFAMNLVGYIQSTIIKVYVPKDQNFNDVTIANDFGDIRLDGMNTKKLTIYSNDGDVAVKDIQSNVVLVENDFGDVTASNVKTSNFTLESNDGDAELSEMDIATSATLTNSFGETSLQEFTSQDTKIESSDGEINIEGELLGKTTIESSFGDIDLELSNKESELSYTIQNDFGDIEVNGNEYESNVTNTADTSNKMDIISNDGDINITLK